MIGAGWRPELALAIERRTDLGFVEITAENHEPRRVARAIDNLRARGLEVVIHGVGLSLGSAEPPCRRRLARLARLATAVGASRVSEHVAFVRSDEHDTGHLLPAPRTRAMLDVLVENVRIAQDQLQLPLALENIATLFEWPAAELDEPDFLTELLERTGAELLLDLSNLHANAQNFGFDAARALDRMPLDRLGYVHVAGGIHRDGLYLDTHAHAVPPRILELVRELASRVETPRILLERDDRYPPTEEWNAELDAIIAAARLEVVR